MNTRTKWGIGVIGGISLLFVLIPLIVFFVVDRFYLTPQVLTPLLKKEIAKRIQGDFSCRSVELSYWETWPYTGIIISDGQIRTKPSPVDRLSGGQPKLEVAFERLVVYLNPLEYCRTGQVNIREIRIECPDIYYRMGDGLSLDLLKDSSEVNEPMDTALMRFDIKQFNITKGKVSLRDCEKDVQVNFSGIQLGAQGDFTGDVGDISLTLDCDSSSMQSPYHALENNLPVHLACELRSSCEERKLEVLSAKSLVNGIPFETSGLFKFTPEGGVWMDASFMMAVSRLEELFDYLPSVYGKIHEEYIIGGKTVLQGTVNGLLAEKVYPDVRLDCRLEHGRLARRGMEHGIDTLDMDFTFAYQFDHPDSAFVTFRDLRISGLDSYVRMKARVTDLFRNPFVDVDIHSSIDFSRLGKELLNPDTIQVSGKLVSDLSAVFRWNDLREGRYDRIWAEGALDIDRMQASSDAFRLRAFLSNVHFSVGYKQNQSDFISQREVLGANLDVDTLGLDWADQLKVSLSRLRMYSNTGLQQDTNAVTPVTSHMKFDLLRARLFDEVALIVSRAELHAGIKPFDANKRQAVGAFVLMADTFQYLDLAREQIAVLSGGKFVTEFYPQKGTLLTDHVSTSDLFDHWETKGYLIFDDCRSFTPYFPLKIHMRGTKLGFRNNRIILDNAQVQVGKTDVLLSGEIETVRRKTETGDLVTGNLSLRSELIDYEELKEALLWGGQMGASGEKERKSMASLLNVGNLDEAIRRLEEKESGQFADRLIRIPENLDMQVALDVGGIHTRNFDMRKVDGQLTLREGRAYAHLATQTDVGNARVDLTYQAKGARKAVTYVDWNMTGIQVGKLKKILPSLNTLFPLLESLDGVIDCKLTACCPLDSSMDVITPELYGTCSLDGRDMVLFDNKTFQELSKKLYFKDKERNQVDRISVDFIAKDRTIDIFPFLLDMDRYRLAVGGTHDMDMKFDYHLTVLKSPIPISFGIDITGKLNQFKYKLVKGKYGPLFTPEQSGTFQEEKAKRINAVREGVLKEIANK